MRMLNIPIVLKLRYLRLSPSNPSQNQRPKKSKNQFNDLDRFFSSPCLCFEIWILLFRFSSPPHTLTVAKWEAEITMAGKEEGSPIDSELVAWLRSRAQKSTVYNALKPDKFSKSWENAETQAAIQQFVEAEEATILTLVGDNMRTALGPPKKLPSGNNKALCFIRESNASLTKENINDEVTVSELTSEPLSQLEMLLSEIYVPLLTNPANQEGWGEVTSKQVADGLHKFLANVSITLSQTKGETCLPLPPMQGFMTPQPPSANKDRIHLLENAIILWTRQIKNVLKMDPELQLKQGKHPLPDTELQFWRQKSKNLNAIFDQLQSEPVRQVLAFLDQSKSTYCTPFAKLCREVFTAREEVSSVREIVCVCARVCARVSLRPNTLYCLCLSVYFRNA